jgi:arsenate reductase
MGVEVEFRDINKQPPPREFLEKHVPAGGFQEFVSRRSPVFKERPLPTTKRELIDLMLEQPNVIRRPILVKGARVLFGFDKDEYRKLLK